MIVRARRRLVRPAFDGSAHWQAEYGHLCWKLNVGVILGWKTIQSRWQVLYLRRGYQRLLVAQVNGGAEDALV